MNIKQLITFLTMVFWTSVTYGQTINSEDSVKIMSRLETIFNSFNNTDFAKFEALTTDQIYCILCFEETDFSDQPYMLNRKEFFNKYLEGITRSEIFIRATKSKDVIFIKENDYRSDITVLLTIYKQDELAPGHEGGQLGIYFKKVNNEYKFAGIETIP